jgi:hypothetical protein
MPGNHSLGFNNDQSRTPTGPNPGKANPENPVCTVKLNPTSLGSAQNIHLMSQSNNLQLQAGTWYEESTNGVKERSKQDLHGARKTSRMLR